MDIRRPYVLCLRQLYNRTPSQTIVQVPEYVSLTCPHTAYFSVSSITTSNKPYTTRAIRQ